MNPAGEQLKMFMTPREIMGKYQALDGDRTNGYLNEARGGDLRAEYTARPENTLGEANRPRADENGRALGNRTANPYWHTQGEETDSQLYSRKLQEAKLPPAEYNDVHRGGGVGNTRPGTELGESAWDNAPPLRTGHTDTYEYDLDQHLQARADSRYQAQAAWDSRGSLYDSIKAEGARDPIHLGTQFGDQGRPQVAGGHHRLASQNDINPDQPMPVIHHEGSTYEARESAKAGGYKYS